MAEERDFLFETAHWKVFLMSEQRYIGRSVVVLKRDCGDLAELTEIEMSDFLAVVRKYETLLKNTFGATMFNWTCLMNMAYQKKPYTPHVHWHVRPRYDHVVEFVGEEFADPNFGEHYVRGSDGGDRMVDDTMVEKIVSQIRHNL